MLVGADISGLQKGLKKATGLTDKVGKSLATVGRVAAPIAGGIAAIGGAAVAASVKLGDLADELLDLEQMTGLTTDQLQEFRRVSTVAGVGVDTIAEAAQRLTTRLRAAGTDTELFVDNMKALGVSSKDATGNLRPMSELLPEIIHAMQGTEDITKRNALAAQIFGRSYQTLAPILGLTTDQFDKARKSAHDMGLVLSRDALNAANEFRIEWQTLRDRLKGAALQIGTELIPAMSNLANFLTQQVIPAVQKFTDVLGITSPEMRAFREEIDGLGEAQKRLKFQDLEFQLAVTNGVLQKAKLNVQQLEERFAHLPAGVRNSSTMLFEARSRVADLSGAMDLLRQKMEALDEPAVAGPIIPVTPIVEAAAAIRDQLTPAQQALLAQLDNIVPKLTALNTEIVKMPEIVREAATVIQETGEKIRTAADAFRELGISTFGGFTDAVADFATGSTNAFRNFVDSAISDLGRLLARFLAFEALKALFPGAGFVSAIGKSFGFLQHGGLAMAGRPYIVGETGPELFIPKVAGDVVANDDLSRASGGPSAGELSAAILSRVGPPPQVASPDAVAVDDWWRRLHSAAMVDWESRGGRLRTA